MNSCHDCLEQQPITGRHFQLRPRPHQRSDCQDKIHFSPSGGEHAGVFDSGDDFQRVAPVEMFGLANKTQSWPGSYWLTFFLCASVHERESNTVTAPLVDRERPVSACHEPSLSRRPNLSPCRRDQQRRFALLRGGYIRIGGELDRASRHPSPSP